MKDKLQALIKEQKALLTKFEEWLNSTTEESSSLDPKKVYIKGHPTRGAEVIKMLEDLGGVNKYNLSAESEDLRYSIGDDNQILASIELPFEELLTELHLPEEVSEVDPPTEEVELIEGEMYSWLNCSVMIYLKNDKSICYDYDHVAGVYMTPESTIRKSISEYRLATQETRDYMFDALEKAGKHFDKENMRLLDVEEWSCEKGLPIIVRNETTNWRADIFHSYDSVDAKYPYCCNSSDECDRLYRYAMPYTEENIYLIGTTDSPNKRYKFVDK